MPTSNNLTYVDAEELMEVPLASLVNKFESVSKEWDEGSYKYIKTDLNKYSMIADNVAHDFKNDITYNSLTYLQMQYETKNLNIIGRELEKVTGASYIKTNTEAVKTAVTDALKTATNDKTFEGHIKEYFGCDYVKLDKDSIKIADRQISLKDIGTDKGKVVDTLKGNREAVKDKEDVIKAKEIQQKIEFEKEKKQEKQQNKSSGWDMSR